MSSYFRLMDPPEQAKDWGLAIIRIVLGLTFMLHGWQKVFEYGIPGVTQAFGQMGAPLPGITGPLVSALELAGGAALIVGLLTRLVAIPLAIDMLGAIFLVVLPMKGISAPLAFELELILLVGALAMLIGGPGALSIDGAIARAHSRAAFATGRA
jgi:putative oxidoreductase